MGRRGEAFNQLLGRQSNILKAYGLPGFNTAPQPMAPAPKPMAPAPKPAQPEFQNDFVYKRPTFGMQRQMINTPSMDWRLGN